VIIDPNRLQKGVVKVLSIFEEEKDRNCINVIDKYYNI